MDVCRCDLCWRFFLHQNFCKDACVTHGSLRARREEWSFVFEALLAPAATRKGTDSATEALISVSQLRDKTSW